MSDKPNPPCGGIWTRKESSKAVGPWQPPGACEVHILPWGHDRADLGILRGLVDEEPA